MDKGPAPSLLDGLHLDGVGVMRKPNITGKGQYGGGAELGLKLNDYVKVGVLNLGYATPDSWRGATIDETSGIGHYTLFTAANKKTSLDLLGSVTYSWTSDAWGLGAGVGVTHTFGKGVNAGISGLIRFWSNEQKEDLLVAAHIGYQF